MAIDHDEHDGNVHESPEQPPPRKRWVTERDEPAANIARARNIAELELSIAVAPDGNADVDSHVAAIGTRIGAGKRRAKPDISPGAGDRT